MEKKWWLYIVYAGVALVIVGGILVASGAVSVDFPTGVSPSFSSEIRLVGTSGGGGVEKYEGSKTYYQVKGVFVSDLQPKGSALEGQFVVDGDPKETSITVAIDTSGGTGKLQVFAQSFDEEDVEASDVPIATVRQKITTGTRAALLLNIDKKDTSTSIRGPLDGAIAGSWDGLVGFRIMPATVAIIEKK